MFKTYRYCILLLLTAFMMPVSTTFAQNSKRVKALKAQQTQLQKKLKQSQRDLAKNKKDVQKGQTNIFQLGQQLDDRLANIRSMEGDIDAVENKISTLRSDIKQIDAQLTDKKQKYARALRFARQFPKVKSPLVFILSADNITKMYRRARYAREYASFQYDMAKQIQHKQSELLEARNQYLAARTHMAGLIRDVMMQRKRLNEEQVAQKKNVADLKKKQKGLSRQVEGQQRELANLNKKIDQLIAYEIEQARKRAEEAARKKAEAERRRKEAEQQRLAEAEARKKAASEKGSANKTAVATPKKETPAVSTPKTTSSVSWLTAEDRQLNGSFEQNRGRLPVPITGQYRIGNRFGAYNVEGLSHVTLDNKGTNYIGHPGARARSIFDGEVSAVFQFGGSKNVLIRHGSYISVYCNLSSVIVYKGQKVHTRDLIGTVMDDGSGNSVLHFQLRKETAKLNPEAWIGR